MVPKISSVVIRFCFNEHFDFMYGLQIKSTKLDFNEYGFDNSIWTCILLANDQMSMTTKVLLIAFMSLGYKFYWNRLWNVCVNGNGPLIILRRRQTRDRVAEKYSVPWNINRYESPSYLLNYVFSPQFKIASPLSSDILSVENLLALQSVIITASS